MATELASFVLSNPTVTQRSASFDAGSTSHASVSGALLDIQIRIGPAGNVVIVYEGVDQSLQPFNCQSVCPPALLTALITYYNTLGQAKTNALIASGDAPAATTFTATAG